MEDKNLNIVNTKGPARKKELVAYAFTIFLLIMIPVSIFEVRYTQRVVWMTIFILLFCLYIILIYIFYEHIRSFLMNFVKISSAILLIVVSIFLGGYIASILNGLFKIDREVWLNFIGAIVGGTLGVTGGYIVAKYQIKVSDQKENEKKLNEEEISRDYIMLLMNNEIVINQEIFQNNYKVKMAKESDCFILGPTFIMKEWERVKYDIIRMRSGNYLKGFFQDIIELYNFIEKVNLIIERNEKLEPKRKKELLINLNKQLIKVEEHIQLIKINKRVELMV